MILKWARVSHGRYVGVEEETGTELFYYLVESERSPGADPVLLWLTGGPRCSGFSAFAFEVGQYSTHQPTTAAPRPPVWR